MTQTVNDPWITQGLKQVDPINWNVIEDPRDLEAWNHLTTNFWLPEKIPVSNDLPSWGTLQRHEQLITMRVFVGLTALDTLQCSQGAKALMDDALTPHEEHTYAYIVMNEAVHAKSYSNIFSTLCTSEEIRDVFDWEKLNPFLQRKKQIILTNYKGDCQYKRKITSVLLESFLFYSGFFLPLYWDSRQKLPNTANMIKLIVRDEAVHGAYIGYKFQRSLEVLNVSEEQQMELREWTYAFLMELYENECSYAADLYDELGLTEQVKKFMRYNANKALMNLGYDPLFGGDSTDVLPSILAALNPEGSSTHDFFSLQGSTYKMAVVEETTDADWSPNAFDDPKIGKGIVYGYEQYLEEEPKREYDNTWAEDA